MSKMKEKHQEEHFFVNNVIEKGVLYHTFLSISAPKSLTESTLRRLL